MNYDNVKARITAFHERNGGECYCDGQYWFYRNGAYRDVDRLGVLVEPPDDSTQDGEFTKAQNILKFYRLRLGESVRDFEHLNTRLAHSFSGSPHDLDELRRLQKIVQKRQEEVTAAEEKLNNTRKGRLRRAHREGMEEQHRKFHEFQQQRRTIRI